MLGWDRTSGRNTRLVLVGALAVALHGLPDAARAQSDPGEAGAVLGCFYECKEAPLPDKASPRASRKWQEVTTLMISNHSVDGSSTKLRYLNGNAELRLEIEHAENVLGVPEINPILIEGTDADIVAF